MKLVKLHCIYCTAGKWERARRRAKAAKRSISRFGIECCRRAPGDGPWAVGSFAAVPELPPRARGRTYVLFHDLKGFQAAAARPGTDLIPPRRPAIRLC